LFLDGNNEGSLKQSEYRIVDIVKVRNCLTESLYECERINIKREMKSDGNVNEQLMFHGPSLVDPVEMVSHRYGMMKDCSNSGFYGRGIYFASLARYSHEGFKHTAKDGQFQLIVCSVICGNSLELGETVSDGTRILSQKTLPDKRHSVIAGPHCPTKAGSGWNDFGWW
jgi:hypothetical protein